MLKEFYFCVFFIVCCSATIPLSGKIFQCDETEQMRVFVDGKFVTLVTKEFEFNILMENVAGSKIISFSSTNYLYPQIRVDINSKGKMRALLNDGSRLEMSVPLKLTPSGKIDYFQKPPPFDPWSYVLNPMGIMIILGVVMMVLPKLIDPEMLKEARETLQQGEDTIRSTVSKKK
jgi:hypothetical protein